MGGSEMTNLAWRNYWMAPYYKPFHKKFLLRQKSFLKGYYIIHGKGDEKWYNSETTVTYGCIGAKLLVV